MTDRELLELAARAAGIANHPTFMRLAGNEGINRGPLQSLWNPLTDDGDALRLAVKIGILVSPNENGKTIAALPTDDDMVNHHMIERHGDDPYAATRRAEREKVIEKCIELGAIERDGVFANRIRAME